VATVVAERAQVPTAFWRNGEPQHWPRVDWHGEPEHWHGPTPAQEQQTQEFQNEMRGMLQHLQEGIDENNRLLHLILQQVTISAPPATVSSSSPQGDAGSQPAHT